MDAPSTDQLQLKEQPSMFNKINKESKISMSIKYT